MRKVIMTPEVISSVLQMLNEGKTVPQIGKILNINRVTINSYLNSHGIFTSPSKGNVHYFDKIDSYAKAYLVGFIAADGSLVKTKTTTTLTITVKFEDKDVLEFLKSEIGNEHKLQEIIRVSSYDKTKTIHHSRYTISDANITKALNNLGIASNKSLTMPDIINNIPESYRDAFIIGYFDGDGSVTYRDKFINNKGYECESHTLIVSLRGTTEFLEGICRHLNVSKDRIKDYDSIPSLVFASKKDIYRFFQCYENLPFFYKRKYDKFLSKINHSSFAKYKQGQTISSSIN